MELRLSKKMASNSEFCQMSSRSEDLKNDFDVILKNKVCEVLKYLTSLEFFYFMAGTGCEIFTTAGKLKCWIFMVCVL